MRAVKLQPEGSALEVRRQLVRVLESSGFTRNERLSRFLRFIVARHIEGRDHDLKESVIGVEVFGRKPDYNPKFDPIVRTEARRLRARLSKYYASEGKGDALVIELPKGGYVPVAHSPRPVESRRQAKARPTLAMVWNRRWLGSLGPGNPWLDTIRSWRPAAVRGQRQRSQALRTRTRIRNAAWS